MPVIKICQTCSVGFKVKPSRASTAKFCSSRCLGSANGQRATSMGYVWKLGHIPWIKGRKGLHLSPATEYKKGQAAHNRLPLGSVQIRKDKHGKRRAFIKIAEPNIWKLRAVVLWEEKNGTLPRGMIVHHKDRNSLNDEEGNLQALTRSDHGKEHYAELLAAANRSYLQSIGNLPQ